jgi:V8-like Glu-specific endopeptidase
MADMNSVSARYNRRILSALAISALAALSQPRAASAENDAAVRAYWTPERLRDAIPLDRHPAKIGPDGLPTAAPDGGRYAPLTTGPDLAAPAQLPPSAPASPPTVFVRLNMAKLYQPKPLPSAAAISPNTIPTYTNQFTTFRVFPSSAAQTFPYAAVGKLFFTIQAAGGIDPPGNYSCTASVIKARVIATAGHCIGSPRVSTGGNFVFYSNWMFIPADTGGAAPFGTWTSFSQGVGGGWSSSKGAVPNAEDWGFIDLNDQGLLFPKKIASVTGAFGYSTLALASKNITQLGYPSNLDNGADMEQNNGTTASAGNVNTWTIGSAMGQGASGGPWVLNFGVAPACSGQCPSGNNGLNALGSNFLVAVDSYGPASPQIGYAGASEFNADWTSLLTTMCGKKQGTC